MDARMGAYAWLTCPPSRRIGDKASSGRGGLDSGAPPSSGSLRLVLASGSIPARHSYRDCVAASPRAVPCPAVCACQAVTEIVQLLSILSNPSQAEQHARAQQVMEGAGLARRLVERGTRGGGRGSSSPSLCSSGGRLFQRLSVLPHPRLWWSIDHGPRIASYGLRPNLASGPVPTRGTRIMLPSEICRMRRTHLERAGTRLAFST